MKEKKLKTIRLNIPATIIAVCATILVVFFAVVLIQPGGVFGQMLYFLKHPLLLLLRRAPPADGISRTVSGTERTLLASFLPDVVPRR